MALSATSNLKTRQEIGQVLYRLNDQKPNILGESIDTKAIFDRNFPNTQVNRTSKTNQKTLPQRLIPLFSYLDKLLEKVNSTGSQVKTFLNNLKEKTLEIFARKFSKISSDTEMKELYQLTQELHLSNEESETYSLLKRLESDKNKKVLIFDIDGTIRDAEFGSEGHMTPNIDPALIEAFKKLKAKKDFEIYFVTTRSLKEVQRSNIPYNFITTFCENGNKKLFGDQIQEQEIDVHPSLSQETQEMDNAIQKYLKTNYPKIETDFITIKGSICFGIKGADYTQGLKDISRDLNLISSKNPNWECWNSGRFIGLRHKDFVSEKYSALTHILESKDLQDQKRRSFYIFGDTNAEVEASSGLKNLLGKDHVQLVMVGSNNSKNSNYQLGSPKALGTLIKNLADGNT